MGHGRQHNRSPRHALGPAISCREFAPTPALSGVVRAYFSFMPYSDRMGQRPIAREALVAAGQPFNLPMLADARSSLVRDLTATCHVDRGWSATAADARVIGPRRVACQPPADDRPEMVGAYLEPGATLQLFGVTVIELTDQTLRLHDVWGTGSRELLADASELDEVSRVDRLEAALRVRRRRSNGAVNIAAMTRWVQAHPKRDRQSPRRDGRRVATPPGADLRRRRGGQSKAVLSTSALQGWPRVCRRRRGGAVGRRCRASRRRRSIAHDRRVPRAVRLDARDARKPALVSSLHSRRTAASHATVRSFDRRSR